MNRQPTKEELLYTAGFFDGEGSVALIKNKKPKKKKYGYTSLMISITNGHQSVLLQLQNILGVGKIYPRKREKIYHRPLWAWAAASKQARYVLDLLYPYLIVKQSQAALGIMFQEFLKIPGCRLSEDMIRDREQFRLSMKKLNYSRRGKGIATGGNDGR